MRHNEYVSERLAGAMKVWYAYQWLNALDERGLKSPRGNAQHVGDLVTLFACTVFEVTLGVHALLQASTAEKTAGSAFFRRVPYCDCDCRVRNWCLAHCCCLTHFKECFVFMLFIFLYVCWCWCRALLLCCDCSAFCWCCLCWWNHSMGIWSCWLHASERHSTFIHMHFVQPVRSPYAAYAAFS